MNEPEEFERARRGLSVEFPYLQVGIKDGITVLAGELPIVIDGAVVDSFNIEIWVPPAGPRVETPVVREIGGRIPFPGDRHIFNDGSACLFIEAEYWFKHPHGMDLLDFVRGPVMTYYIAQFYYEQHGKWPFADRRHGVAGVVDFFAPLAGTSVPAHVKKFIEMSAAKKLRSKWRCYCGSGRMVDGCHLDAVRRVREKIPRAALIRSLGWFEPPVSTPARKAS